MSDNEFGPGLPVSSAGSATMAGSEDASDPGVQPAVSKEIIEVRCPDDPHSEDYALWCEINACPTCDGVGEDFIEDEFDIERGEWGVPWTCPTCGGSGIDPAACETGETDVED